MATAKLWWNGSSWATSSTYWKNEDSTGNQQLGVNHKVLIAAYDDFTIKLTQSCTAYQTAAIYNSVYLSSNGVTVTSGSTTIGTGNFSNADVTNYSSFSYSGQAGAAGNAQGSVYYSGGRSFSGSTTITTPFYVVSYDANGGSGAPNATKGVNGFDGTLSETIPTRENHTFLGWATSSSAHVAEYSAGGTITARSSDVTLYAVWSPAVVITADEGSTITFDGVSYTNETAVVNKVWGQTYPLVVAPNAGWIIKTQSHPNGDVEIDADEITITATSQRVGCHIDDGESWVQAVMYLDTGEDWVMVQAYYDNGNSWELVY